jgi:drug/metabolite transporter (DMT)-like permease
MERLLSSIKHNAALFILVASFFLASHDSLAKVLTAEYPVVEIIWGRYVIHMAVMMWFMRNQPSGITFRSSHYGLHSLRAVCLLGIAGCFITGLNYIPLAEATAVNFLYPLFVLVLTPYFFAERVTLFQWGLVVTGLVGVLFIVRPGGSLFSWEILFPCAAALFNSLYQVLTRIAAGRESAVTSNFLVGVIALLICSAVVPFYWSPLSLTGCLLIVLLGVLGTLAHLSLACAFTYSTPALLAPFGYSQIIFALMFGFVLFGALPDRWSMVGITLIALSGVATLLIKRRCRHV